MQSRWESTVIDDVVLEDLLERVAAAVDEPADGPERVMAARDALDRARRRTPASRRDGRPSRRPQRQSVALGLAAVAATAVGLAVLLSAHNGGSSTSSGARSASIPSPLHEPAGPAAVGTGSGSGGATKAVGNGGATGVVNQAPSTGVSPNEVPSLPTKVIKTGTVDLNVRTGELDDTMSRLTDLAVGFGGFVASSSTNAQTTGEAPFGDVTLRVPVGSFEELLAQVQSPGFGTVTSVTTSGQDVTAQYVDLQARIQSLDDARTQFEQIMARAQTIGDLLTVEDQISNLETQIEQLQGQLQVMDNQTTYSTLTVHVTERGKAAAATKAPPSGVSKAWTHARHSFVDGVESVVAASGGLAVFLLFAGLIVVGGRFGWLFLRRRLV